MKKFFKYMLGIGGCIFYYIVVCAILGVDVYDPWNKVMEWAQSKQKKSNDIEDINLNDNNMMKE